MTYDIVVLVIDNYDSFVYNLVHVLAELGARSVVVRNDEISVRGVERINPDRIIISPGPGTPLQRSDIGISIDIVRQLGWRIPVLGVCLGHQIIGVAFGAKIRRSSKIMHGKTSIIEHYGNKLFRGIPDTFVAMRYHSLVVHDVPQELEITSRSTDDREIMGIKHIEHPIHGVQFHPESIGTPHGPRILKNFLDDPY